MYMLIILATQEAEIRGITDQIVLETLSQKTLHKNRTGGVAQGEGPEFKPQFHKKEKKRKKKWNVKQVSLTVAFPPSQHLSSVVCVPFPDTFRG
jgi:hypothetical protein